MVSRCCHLLILKPCRRVNIGWYKKGPPVIDGPDCVMPLYMAVDDRAAFTATGSDGSPFSLSTLVGLSVYGLHFHISEPFGHSCKSGYTGQSSPVHVNTSSLISRFASGVISRRMISSWRLMKILISCWFSPRSALRAFPCPIITTEFSYAASVSAPSINAS